MRCETKIGDRETHNPFDCPSQAMPTTVYYLGNKILLHSPSMINPLAMR